MNPIEMGKIYIFLVFIFKFILALKALKKKVLRYFLLWRKSGTLVFVILSPEVLVSPNRIRGAQTRTHRRLLILLSDLASHHKQQFVLKIISNSIIITMEL